MNQLPRPIGGLLDPRFVYVPAAKTDIRATIARAREALANGTAPLNPQPKKAPA